MPTQLQLRRGTSAQTAVFTGASGEITVDIDKNVLILHDGVQAGGHPVSPLEFTQAAFDVANSAFGGETAAGVQANAAFDHANSAYDHANTLTLSSLVNGSNHAHLNSDGTVTLPIAGVSGTNARIQSPTGNVQINAGGALFTFSNNNTLIFTDGSAQQVAYPTGTYETAHAAFDKANTAYTAASDAYSFTSSVQTYAQAGYAKANSANVLAQNAFDRANTKFNTAGGEITGDVTIDGQANVINRLAVGSGSYTILPNLIAQFTGTSDYYSQINQQNLSGNGSGDIVVTSDNGTDQINFIDMGIAGSTYDNSTPNAFPPSKPNDGYLYLVGDPGSSVGGNLVIGTAGSGSHADIAIVQGNSFNETARFKAGQGFIVKTGVDSTSTTTGALVVQGGAGISGNVYATAVYDNGIRITSYVDSSNTKMKSYVDNANTSMKSYVDTANTSMKSYVDTANTNMKSYVDGVNTAIQVQFTNNNGVNNTQNTNITNAATVAQAAFDSSNTKFSSSGGTINGSVNVNGDINATGNITYSGSVTSTTITGNTGQFFGYTSNGFNALYSGLPTGYVKLPNEVAEFAGSNNSYIQINFQNENGGVGATTDWVATANNGDDTNYYVDLGIAGSGYDNSNPNNSLGTSLFPNDSYLYAQGNAVTPGSAGGNLVIGAATTGKNVKILGGGINSGNVVTIFTGSSVNLLVPLQFQDSTTQTTAASPVAYTTAAFAKANGAVQTGFTTITANGTSIASSSNTDTLTITAATANGINVLNPTNKTIDIGLRTTGVIAKTYGDISNIPSITVDAFGRVTSVSNTAVSIPPATSVYANTGQLTANTATGTVAIGLATTSVTAGTYSYPSMQVDAYGRVISISNQTPVTSWNGMTGAVTLSSANVVSALTYTPVNKAGDTLSGNFTGITNLGASTHTLDNGAITSNSYTTVSTAQVAVDSFSTSTYRTADYQISITSGSSYHITEVSVLHDGTSVWMDQYSEVFTVASLGTFDADIVTGNLRLLFTPTNASTTVKILRKAINV